MLCYPFLLFFFFVSKNTHTQNLTLSFLKEFKEAGWSAAGCPCHVAKAEDRSKLIEFAVNAFPGCQQIDILVSNAAVSPSPAPLEAMPGEIWDKLFDVNVKSGEKLLHLSFSSLKTVLLPKEFLSPFTLFSMAQPLFPFVIGFQFDSSILGALLVSEAVKHMKEGSSIVLVSSIGGFTPSAPLAGYGVTKTAMFGLTKGLAAELGASKRIRVNCVAPGPFFVSKNNRKHSSLP